ncbi:MAG TPA: tetratricopeptide repeat protein [Candidatus Eisenbacteria bacterium]
MPGKKEVKNRHPGAATAPPGPRASTLSPNVLGILCAFAAVALYLPALPYGWVWDDRLLVTSSGAGGVGAEGFRLLTSLLFRLEWALGYGSPLFAHMISIFLHGLATWLFFRIALHVGARPWTALAATLLFAAHPVHVEAVAYISGLPDLLATVFVLTALLLARSAELCRPEGCRSWKIWPAYAAMVAAVLSDEVAIVAPLLLVGLDRWGPVRVPWRQRLTHYSGFFAIVLVYLLVRYVSGGGPTPTPGSADAVSGIDAAARGWAVPMAFLEYLKMLVYPHPLNALRTLHSAEVASWTSRLAPFAALAGLALIVAWRRRDPVARAGALLLLLPLLPALPLPPFIGSFAVERGAYLASVGFCLIVASIYAWAARSFPAGRPLLFVAAVAIAGLAGLTTLLRLPVWRDNVTLLFAAAAADPKDPEPHLTLVDYFGHARQWQAALTEIDRAIALDPKNHAAIAKRTAILSQLGRNSDAEASARRAIDLEPNDAASYANLSDALLQQNKIEQAVEAARRATEIDSTFADGWYNYGVALAAYGDAKGAILAYEKTLALHPDDILALNNLGTLLGSTGKVEEARNLFIRLAVLAPKSAQVHMNLSLAYLRLGDRESAAREREEVRKLDPAAAKQLDQMLSAHVKEIQRAGAKKAAR